MAQEGLTSGGGEGNLDDIVQTTTSYDDGGVNVVTAYLSDGTTEQFQIRNGHKGSQGLPGQDGQNATVAVGTTTTLPAGSDATVTNSGTASAAVFNFGIPQGVQGVPGQDGADGADGFSPTATVSKSGDTATITITDKDSTTTTTITDGADGTAATISVGTTSTLPAGSSATVTNSGTSSAAVFNFGIPKGDKGDTGSTGATGPAGPGVPTGGSTGQVLTKNGSANYDTIWSTLSIPTVNDATLTVTQGGSTLGSFTANSNTDTTIDIPSASGSPTGTISMFAGSTAPTGYLICDGSAVSRTTYADLFTVIGTTYGTGDGSTTFNLPNLKGKVPVGLDSGDTDFDALGETGGAKTHTLTSSEIPAHTHPLSHPSNTDAIAYHSTTGTNHWFAVSGSGSTQYPDAFQYKNPTVGSNTGGGGAHNNVQPYIVLNYIIKT